MECRTVLVNQTDGERHRRNVDKVLGDGTTPDDGDVGVVPTAGTVTQVCRKWGVYEDEVYAYKLQEKEIEMHYGKNRQVRHLVRSDLKQAKDLQMEETTEAVSQDRATQSLELEDEMLARRLQQELEGEITESIKSLELADKRMAKDLQKLETDTTGGFLDRRLHKPHKLKSASSTDRHHRHHQHLNGDRVELEFLQEVGSCTSGAIDERPSSIKKKSTMAVVRDDIDDDENLRLMQEEQDARLARELQDEESQRKSRDYLDEQLAIEAQDRELAKLLQEQERSKARRAARQKHQKSSKLQSQSLDLDVNPPKDQDRSQSSVKSKRSQMQPVVGFSTGSGHRPVRPTELSVSSSYNSHGEPRLEPAPRRRPDTHFNRSRSPPQPDNGNVATIIDPTYRRNNHSNSKRHEFRHDGHSVGGTSTTFSSSSSPVLPTPTSLQSGSIEGLYPSGDEYDQVDLDDDQRDPQAQAAPYMPIQGQRRPPQLIMDKRKKKDNCKQQ